MKEEYNADFFILEIFPETGGIVYVHNAVNQVLDDFALNIKIAHDKARRGHVVYILPTLHERDERRAIIFFDSKPLKNPDLRIDDVLHEVEAPTKPGRLNNLKHRISEGAHQANFVILNLETSIDINLMRRVCKAKFIDHKELLGIEFRYKEIYIRFLRGDFFYEIKEPLL
jgi:hypothetical protein